MSVFPAILLRTLLGMTFDEALIAVSAGDTLRGD